MTYFGSEEHQPVTWFRGHPVYATHFVVLVWIASMLITTVLSFANNTALLAWTAFSSDLVLHGQVWRIATYGLWNPPSLWFAIDMLMLVWFGREVEKFFGRGKFFSLYASVYLLRPLVFTALGPWLPITFAGESGAFAVFVAFAALYPNVPILFTLLAKWVALILIAIYTLMALADHNWETLISLWVTSGFAYGFVRYQQGHFAMPRMKLRSRRPKLRIVPDAGPKPASPVAPANASMAEVDALLDKIAQSGIESLTPKERAKLDAARRRLQKRAHD